MLAGQSFHRSPEQTPIPGAIQQQKTKHSYQGINTSMLKSKKLFRVMKEFKITLPFDFPLLRHREVLDSMKETCHLISDQFTSVSAS